MIKAAKQRGKISLTSIGIVITDYSNPNNYRILTFEEFKEEEFKLI